MGITFFTLSGLVAPLQHLASWFVGAAPQPVRAARQPAWLARPASVRSRKHPAPMRAPAPHVLPVAARRPLRVVRVVEPSRPSASAGRMVISGRMADVCAELDRLAALESSGHKRCN